MNELELRNGLRCRTVAMTIVATWHMRDSLARCANHATHCDVIYRIYIANVNGVCAGVQMAALISSRIFGDLRTQSFAIRSA